jgi:hypothetical protein
LVAVAEEEMIVEEEAEVPEVFALIFQQYHHHSKLQVLRQKLQHIQLPSVLVDWAENKTVIQ